MVTIAFPQALESLVTRDETVLAGYGSDALFQARPQALARPKSTEEIQRLLAYCNAHGFGVTACGNQTSLTGASVCDQSLLLSMENLSKRWRCREDPQKPGRWLVDAGPAIVLSELQDALAERGFFYPPDPTSRCEILLGSTLATNASGEDSYKYGATRRWVRGITYVRADGTIARAERAPHEEGSSEKGTCGYPIRGSRVDLLIGSEGTLGIITEVTLEVLPFLPKYFALLFFLPSEEEALRQVKRLHESEAFDLRCLEYMDAAALAILAEKGVEVPEAAGAMLYIKQEFDVDEDEKMALWTDYLETLYGALHCENLMDHALFAGDAATRQRLRGWRHFIPATINERAARLGDLGGGKVGTDWFVPVGRLEEMFARVRRDQGSMEWVVFGHIGNGHPHFNFIARDAAEYRKARELLLEHCRLAVSLGGGVSGEHGLGKLKAHLLGYQYGETEIQAMLAVKRELDPKGILAPGNIFGKLSSGA